MAGSNRPPRRNLPHAGTIAVRILYHLQRRDAPAELQSRATTLALLLEPLRDAESDPSEAEAAPLAEEAARQAREIVGEIERRKLGDDRLGQAVRNLFECLGLPEEGAALSLRAGENPRSPLRPTP